MRPVRVLALLAALTLGQPAAAQSAADKAEIRAAIAAQLDAFNRDDSAAAYGFAAPNIQAIFPTADIFMRMVESGYAPVFRSRSHIFGGLEERGGALEQRVFITDAGGEGWLALYTVAQQPDGSWKITGCSLARRPGEAV